MHFFRKWLILMIFLLTARKNNSGTVIPWEKPRNDSASHGRLSSLQTNAPQYSHAFQSAEGQLARSTKGQRTKQKEKSSMGKTTQKPTVWLYCQVHAGIHALPRQTKKSDSPPEMTWKPTLHGPAFTVLETLSKVSWRTATNSLDQLWRLWSTTMTRKALISWPTAV